MAQGRVGHGGERDEVTADERIEEGTRGKARCERPCVAEAATATATAAESARDKQIQLPHSLPASAVAHCPIPCSCGHHDGCR